VCVTRQAGPLLVGALIALIHGEAVHSSIPARLVVRESSQSME